MRIEVVRHVPYIYYGNLGPWLKAWGVDVWEKRFFQNTEYPDMGQPDLCLVLGGPMGVYDTAAHPWLINEKRFLEQRMKQGVKIFAICLGGQLIAEILGARVGPAQEPEIGWHPVRIAREAQALPLLAGLPKEWVSFHWHNDVFDLPSGCTRLFETDAYAVQGYSYSDHVVATQFHPEMNEEGAKNLLWRFGSNIDHSQKWVQNMEEIKSGFIHECKNVSILQALIDRLCDS